MITRPLDLAARLSPVSRGWDALFYVNVGALAVFFFVFGSRFVLAPGLAVDFALPEAGGAATSTLMTDVVIAVPASGMVVVNGAVLDLGGLGPWLRGQAGEGSPRKRLLVQVTGSLPARDLARLYSLAADAGFAGVLIATSEAGGAGDIQR
jgi:hypothetical protein